MPPVVNLNKLTQMTTVHRNVHRSASALSHRQHPQRNVTDTFLIVLQAFVGRVERVERTVFNEPAIVIKRKLFVSVSLCDRKLHSVKNLRENSSCVSGEMN